MKIGIIRETKTPGDSRAPLTPEQAGVLRREQNIDLIVQSSKDRIFTDDEYRSAEVPVSDDLSDRDILLGVKEVDLNHLLPKKTYFFFSHTIKEQPYNRDLLRKIIDLEITLIDYEVLTNDNGERLIAFGRFAGIVGAHNGIMTYGLRNKCFSLPRLISLKNYKEAKIIYSKTNFPPMKVVLTGTGRVGGGAAEVLNDMGFRRVNPKEFLELNFSEPVYCQLGPEHYSRRKDGKEFQKSRFYSHPVEFESSFTPYYTEADVFINGIYWDNDAPKFFSLKEMRSADFKIQVIADITCDIAPVSSIPSTLRPSTISDPIYGFNPLSGKESTPHKDDVVDVMAIDNLPNELPRDASESFGEQFIAHILPELLEDKSPILDRATIATNGHLGSHFHYLKDYVVGS